MNISRDGQAGEGRKGSMKEREGKEGVNMKQGLDFDSSALRGGPFQRLLCSFLPRAWG